MNFTCICAVRCRIRTGAVHSAVAGRARYDPASRDPSVQLVFAVTGEGDRIGWFGGVDLRADPLEVPVVSGPAGKVVRNDESVDSDFISKFYRVTTQVVPNLPLTS